MTLMSPAMYVMPEASAVRTILGGVLLGSVGALAVSMLALCGGRQCDCRRCFLGCGVNGDGVGVFGFNIGGVAAGQRW